MALLDFLKRKKNVEKAKENKKPVHVGVEKPVKKTEKVSVASATPAPAKSAERIKAGKFSYSVIDRPHISEKATYLSENNQYVFKVSSSHNKNEVKKAMEGIYGVEVLSVNFIKVPAKKRRLGKVQGFKKGYKKAIVKIKEGQKIEIL